MNRKIIEKNLKEMNLSRSYLERNFVTPLTTTLTTTTMNNKQITNDFNGLIRGIRMPAGVRWDIMYYNELNVNIRKYSNN